MPASQVDVSFNFHFLRLSFCGPGQDSGLTIVTNGECPPLWLSINEDQLRTHEVVGSLLRARCLYPSVPRPARKGGQAGAGESEKYQEYDDFKPYGLACVISGFFLAIAE